MGNTSTGARIYNTIATGDAFIGFLPISTDEPVNKRLIPTLYALRIGHNAWQFQLTDKLCSLRCPSFLYSICNIIFYLAPPISFFILFFYFSGASTAIASRWTKRGSGRNGRLSCTIRRTASGAPGAPGVLAPDPVGPACSSGSANAIIPRKLEAVIGRPAAFGFN